MSRKEPTNADIMAELRTIRALLEGIALKAGLEERPVGLLANVKGYTPQGVSGEGPVMSVK